MYMEIKFKKGAVAAFIVVFALLCVFFGSCAAYCFSENAESDGDFIEIPILMYHSVCINRKVDSEYYITPEKFESDLAYLASNGYTAVFISEITDYADGVSDLPQKPIAITFDDGYYNGLCHVLPLLKKYGMKATFNIVGEYAERYSELNDTSPAYAYLSWSGIKELADSGLAEIGNHTYAMHSLSPRRGCSRMRDESLTHYETALFEDVMKLQSSLSDNCGVTPTVFAYPFGEISREAVTVLQQAGFRALLTCSERVNKIVRSPDPLYSLGRINRASHYSTVAFMAKYGL